MRTANILKAFLYRLNSKCLFGITLFLFTIITAVFAQPNISRIEYYIDTDPGFGNGTNLPVGTGNNFADLNIAVNPQLLTEGVHRLYVRARSANGWGLTNTLLFYKPYGSGGSGPGVTPPANITRVEYYIDTDPGFGAATTLNITAGTNIQDVVIAINPANITEGVHRLYVRGLNGDGKWGLTNTLLFYKPYGSGGSIPGNNPPSNITRVEYYLDTDPGYGAATTLNITAGTDIQDVVIAINPTSITEGVHRLYVRGLNADGKWGLTNTLLFYKPYNNGGGSTAGRVPNLKLLEYFVDTDPGIGLGVPVAIDHSQNVSDLLVPVNILGLTVGNHQLNLRAQDSLGSWSLVDTLTFNVPIILSAPAIIVTNINQLPKCAGDSIQVSFSRAGTYGSSNRFNLELSDAPGSFAAPVILGFLTSTNAGVIQGKLPAHLATGSGYRIRVSSSDPVISGVTYSTDLSFIDQPLAQTITGSTNVNGGSALHYSVPAINGSTWQWILQGGTQTSGTNTSNINVQFTQPAGTSSAGFIKAIESSSTGCAADTSALDITIYRLRISNTPAFADLCKGGSVNIAVSVDGNISAGNTYTAQLSDATGSFASPVSIGFVDASGIGLNQTASIVATIPPATANGSAYRIRVISSAPAFTGASNSLPLNIGAGIAAPTASVTANPGCVSGTGTIVVTAPSGAGITYSIGGVYQASGTFTGLAAGNYAVTAQNASGCTSAVTNLVIIADAAPVATVTASGPLSFCQGGSVTLTSSATTGNVWSNGANTQSITVNSSGTYFVTVGTGDCLATSANTTVTVTPATTATFAVIAPFCSGSQAPLLPTTSINGIAGTWSPAVISNTNSGTYIFTPSAGQCITATPLNVVVLPVAIPVFAAIPDITPGSTAPLLPSTSQNGINGTWNPAIISNTQTGNYTFTPAAGQCAAPVTITVTVKVAPDVAVQNVTTSLNTISPNDQLTVSWNVANVGTTQSAVNWTEKIYIQSVNGDNRTLLKQSDYSTNGVISVNQNISRSDVVTIPVQLSVGDQAAIVVEIIPGASIPEVAGAQANNTGVQQTALTIRKFLSLELSSGQLTEGAADGITVRVNRTGALTNPLVVNIAANQPQRYNIPATVTIPAGQSVIAFSITAIDNNVTEGTIKDTIKVTASGFQAVNAGFEVLDNDNPSLSITSLPSDAMEGATVNFRVTTNLAPAVPLQVFLNSTNQARFPVPASVTIPAGATFVNVSVNLAQDNIPEVETAVTINAAGTSVNSASASILIKDDDLPGLQLVLQTNTISETAGYFATQATLRRTTGSNPIAFTANLSASIPGTLILPPSISLAAGENEKTFTVGVIDNTLVDGDRLVNITAAIFVNSCGCNAPPSTAGSVSAGLTVTDNDGPSLQLSATPLTLLEGSANAGLLRITRNTSTNQPLTVNLVSSNTGEATLPTIATIPAGAAFVEIPIITINDGVTDGSKQVNFEATSAGFSPGTVWVLVTDLNKPDLQIPAATISNNPLQAMTIFNYQLSVKNTGFATAPTGVVVQGYLSLDDVIDDADTLITVDTISSAIPVGQSVQLVNAASVPNLPGQYKLIFKVNPASVVTELLLTNNTSQPLAVTINPDYTATAIVTADYFIKGTAVTITGKATKSNAAAAANVPVDVYVITQGFRRTITASTDASGNYTSSFVPLTNEAGHYIVGAGYPGTNGTAEQDAFDILGVKINNGQIPQFKVIINDTSKGTLTVQNLSNKDLTRFTLAKISLPNGAVMKFDTIAVLAGNSTASLGYSITGTALSPGINFEVAGLGAVSNEGNIQPQDVLYYCQAPNGFIEASITKINVNVSESAGERLVEFKLSNKGFGLTGNVKINLPSLNWLSSITPTSITQMAPGDSTLVILKFSALQEVPFNFPINGSIGISSQNGNSFNIPFTFQKVSETTGSIKITATDQFTYYSDAAPKVADAHVVVKNYYTGEIYAEGNTDVNGIFEASGIPEGTHKIEVDKDKHLPYSNTITINPGNTVEQTAFLNYQAITFSWTVVPTAVQDQYDITLTTQFETNVPVPIVTIDMPKTMPQLSGSDVYAFNATLTNHGLITAKDVTLNLPNGDAEYEFVTNYVPADLLAQQSIQVPVIMRRRTGGRAVGGRPSYGAISQFLGMRPPSNSTLAGDASNCTDFAGVVYWYKCNLTTGLWQNGGTLFTYSGRICSSETVFPPISIGVGGGPGGGYPICAACPCIDCGQGIGTSPTPPAVTERSSCVHCITDIISAVAGCAGATGPSLAICVFGVWYDNGGVLDYIESCVPGAIPGPIGCVAGIASAINTCAHTESAGRGTNSNKPADALADPPLGSVFTEIGVNFKTVTNAYQAREDWGKEYFGSMIFSDSWNKLSSLLAPYVTVVDSIRPNAQATILSAMTGYEIQQGTIQAFFTRWNTSVYARSIGVLKPDAQYPEIINWISVKSYSDSMVTATKLAVAKGYQSVYDMYVQEFKALNEILDNQSKAVCASVTVQLSQKLTMTREAFEGTLEIFNGHPTDKMDSLTVNIQITDENGVPSNGLFQINTKSLTNLSDVTGTGNIAAQEKGSVKFLFIPEIGAAPTAPKLYNFGGSVRYFDPYAKAIVTLPLAAVQLTVNPSPNLFLHYFLERNILGDDALTSPAIEPSVPAELAVMVENQGYGPAVNMTISSAQPKIIDNEKGLAINFNLVGSNFQGQPRNLGVTNINFGTIPPLQTRIGEWYLTSSLLGKFVSYDAKVVHNNSFGNPDLSLVKGVKLHELTKSIKLYGDLDDGINDFLVNDYFDVHDLPDIIYFSQGNRTAKVTEAASGSFSAPVAPPSFTNTLTVTASAIGWNFIKLDDPGSGQYDLVSVTRNDGQSIPLDNAWLTFVTLPVSQAPVYENKFHFVDTFSSATAVTYTIVWKPKNFDVPKVIDITGVPAAVTSTQVQQVTVLFNKHIDPATFTFDDLTLTFQGGANISTSAIKITQVDTATFTIDLSAVTTGNGFYNLTVQAADVKDVYSINGLTGKQVTWTQFLTVPSVQAFLGLPAGNIAMAYDTIQVLFNLPIDEASVTPARFSIFKDGVLVPGTVTIDSVRADHKLFYLSGLGNMLTQNGVYEFRVDLPNIKSVSQEPGVQPQSINLTVDNTGPAIVSLEKSNAGGLDPQHITFVNIKFNEEVFGFNTASVQLTRNGEVLPLNIAQLSNTDLKTWMAGNFGLLTYPDGLYTFTVNTNGFADAVGNKGTTSQQITWTVNRAAQVTITNFSVTPDLGNSNSDGITAGLSLGVSFNLSAAAAQVTISQVDLSGEVVLTVIPNVAAGNVSLPFILSTGGNTTIKITITGVNGGETTAQQVLFIDQVPLTGKWILEPNQILSRQLDTIPLSFSGRLLSDAGLPAALQLKKDGATVPSGQLRFSKINDTAYNVYGIRSTGTGAGNYEIGISLQPFSKYSSGLAGSGIVLALWKVVAVNRAPVANAGADFVVTAPGNYSLDGSGSSDPDGNTITYQWVAPDGIVLSDATAARPSFTITSANQGTYSFLLIVSDGTLFTTDVVEVKTNLPAGNISFTGLANTYCINAAVVTLVGSPTGGIFSGDGISGNTFDPSAAGAGVHIITYSLNGEAYSQNTTITALTVPVFAAITPICAGSSAPVLPAISGNGITGTWSPAVVSNTVTATYSFTPADDQCAAPTTIEVVVSPLPQVELAPIAAVCSNVPSIILSGGTPAGGIYSGTSVINGQFYPPVAGVGIFPITYTASDNNGCINSAVQSITVNDCSGCTPTISASSATTFCQGSSVTLTASEGVTYLWSNGETTRSISVTTAGNYSVTVTSASNCSGTSAATVVTVNDLPVTPIITAGSSITFCTGDSVVLTSSEAAGYLWNNGATTKSITVKTSGANSVTTVNTEGCGSSASAAIAVLVNPLPAVSLSSHAPMCITDAALILSGGLPAGGTYSGTGVSNGVFDPAIAGVGSFIITYSFTNASGCSDTAQQMIAVTNCNPDITFNITASSGPNGSISPNGNIPVNSGANQTFIIAANPGFVIQQVLVDGATQGAISSYTFSTVTTAHTISATFVAVGGCTAPVLSTVITRVSCKNGNNGAINLSTTGGSEPFTYAWSGPGFSATTANIAMLKAGIYSVTVSANGGCKTSARYTVEEPAALVISAQPGIISCFNGTTSVVVSGTGGNLPYTGTGTFTNVVAGNYTYTITDAKGCSATTAIKVNEPAPVSVTVAPGIINCFGGNTSVLVSATGGSLPYTGIGTITNQAAGGHNYQVTDARGCTATRGIYITEPGRLRVNAVAQAITCSGGTTTVTVNAAGGTLPYTGTGSMSNQAAGGHNYQVTDARGCVATRGIYIPEPGPLRVTAVAGVIACAGGTTTVTVSASGGTPPYSGTGTITGQAAGTRSYIVTDAVNCTAAKSITIAPGKGNCLLSPKYGGAFVTLATNLKINPNPARQLAVISFNAIQQGKKFEMIITNATGRKLFIKQGIASAGANAIEVSVGHYPAGVYLVTLVINGEMLTEKLVKFD